MHKLSSGLLRAHTLGYTLTRPALVEREREREREKEGGKERDRERERDGERKTVHSGCTSHVSLEKAAIR